MEIPEDAPKDKYESTFVYEKDGVQQEFTLENYPKDDSTWKFVSSNNVLVEKGYEPPIHDLTMDDPDEGEQQVKRHKRVDTYYDDHSNKDYANLVKKDELKMKTLSMFPLINSILSKELYLFPITHLKDAYLLTYP